MTVDMISDYWRRYCSSDIESWLRKLSVSDTEKLNDAQLDHATRNVKVMAYYTYGEKILGFINSKMRLLLGVYNISDQDTIQGDALCVLHDVFLELAKKLYHDPSFFKCEKHLKNWLYKKAMYSCYDYVDTNYKKELEKKEKISNLIPECENRILSDFIVDKITYAGYVDLLNDNDREIVHFYLYMGYDMDHIANYYGISKNTARQRYKRAIEKLKTIMRKDF